MTDPAAFLRRHPEVEKTFTDVYSTENGLRMNEHHARLAALAAVLPAILRAHEADLAGRDIMAGVYNDYDGQYVVKADYAVQSVAAAYLAGRAAEREEAAGDIEDADPQLAEFIRTRERRRK